MPCQGFYRHKMHLCPVALGTLATPPPLDKVITESVVLMCNLPIFNFVQSRNETLNIQHSFHVNLKAPLERKIHIYYNMMYWETDFPSSAYRDVIHVGAPHPLGLCSDIINTPWIKQLWQPPESPDAAGRTSVDLTADPGVCTMGPQ